MLIDAAFSALVNLVIFAGLPFLLYYLYHKLRHKRGLKEIAERAGVQLGKSAYIGYCALFAIVVVGLLLVWPPSLESSVRDGSGFQSFKGLGFSTVSVTMALLYGVIKTGFAEEFLFRGLIAGSLSRVMPGGWANFIQALIFLLPHLLLLIVMPEMWMILPVVLVGSLFAGWVRIRSDSMVGPWIIHAAANVTMALSVAIRSAS
jgi:membrane protease YdiL (CAAX protease family)